MVAALAAAQQPPEPKLHADVRALLDDDDRDAAMQRILRRGDYRGPGTYEERAASCEVMHVVRCEQKRGGPIVAVFVHAFGKKRPNVSKGHLIKVTADGAILRCWQGYNMVFHEFDDINGDGIVERVEMINYSMAGRSVVRELFVLPVTADVQPALRIAIGLRPKDSKADFPLGYRVKKATQKDAARIQIGPVDKKTGGLSRVTAEWRWHAKHEAWVGPAGGPNKEYVVLPPVGHDGLEEFEEAWYEKSGNKKSGK